MIQDPQHTLTALEVLPPLGLRLSFADGATLSVDLAPTVRTHRALAALADPALFATACLDSHGGYVIWIEDDLEMAADNLRNLAVEQAGGIGHERLANWMAEHGLTQEGLDHNSAQDRALRLVMGLVEVGRISELLYPWKCKLTEGSRRCPKILPRQTLAQMAGGRHPTVPGRCVARRREAPLAPGVGGTA